jgi:monoterpene epsilon-lactone hydrolase
MTEAQGSRRARQTVRLLRAFVKPRLEKLVAFAAAAQRRLSPFFAQQIAPFESGIPGEWIPAACGAPVATMFYLHGGGFVVGSPRLFRFVARQFARAGFNVFTPAYRLAPEHVFPAALDDVFRAYEAFVAATPGPIVIAGDSAGGGLAVSLMLRARDAGLRLPVAAALFSPWTDMAVAGASARENEAQDAFFTRRAIFIGARAYLGGAKAKDPLASPVYAGLAGLPPMVVHAGRDEALRDDSARLVEKARAAGVEFEFEMWPEVPHAWQMMAFLPEARASREKAIAFLKRRLSAV